MGAVSPHKTSSSLLWFLWPFHQLSHSNALLSSRLLLAKAATSTFLPSQPAVAI